jgi:hypothetical protein
LAESITAGGEPFKQEKFIFDLTAGEQIDILPFK